jgi:hypothetical protein
MRLVKVALAAAFATAAILAASVPAAPAASAADAGLPVTHVTPDPSAPGTATTFDVFCGRDAVSGTLFGATLGLADLILMHSTASTMPGEFVVTVTLPASIAPGTYHPSFDCSNGVAGNATLRVNPVPGQAPQTGDGATATETGTPLEPIGYGLIGLGVLSLSAVVVLGRRRTASRD